jgi:hypothetical protein
MFMDSHTSEEPQQIGKEERGNLGAGIAYSDVVIVFVFVSKRKVEMGFEGQG